MLRSQEATIKDLDRRLNLRATEKGIGQYLERISQAIPSTLGKRPHAFKLDDPAFFEQEFDTEHGGILKGGVEKMIEKLEIISSIAMKNKKFKVKAEGRIDRLERVITTLVSKDELGKELEKVETRISGFVTEQLQV